MSLKVRYQNKRVGKISLDDNSQITFDYSSSWKESSDSFPVSISLPLSGKYKGISWEMALSVGSENDPGQIRNRDWQKLAAELEIRPALLKRIILDLIK